MRAAALVAALAATPAAACEWSIGWEHWPPYQYEAGGVLTGLDVELMHAVAEEAGCVARFQEAPWARHLNELAQGDIDLAAAATRTAEREGFAFFSDPYRHEAVALLTRDNSAYDSLAGLLDAGGNLGIVLGYAYGEAVLALLTADAHAAQVSAVNSDVTNYRKLLGGRIDGMLLDPYVAGGLKARLGGETRIVATVAEHPVHVMFSRRSMDAAAVARFNAALAAIRADGRYDEIIMRYTGS